MKISVVGIPWYRAGQYLKLRARFTDGDKLHSTYEQWLKAAKMVETRFADAGTPTVRAEIEPDTFFEWCKTNHQEPDAKARGAYANACAFEYYREYSEEIEFMARYGDDLEEALSAQLHLSRSLADAVERFSTPLFRLGRSDIPEPIGTGIFVTVADEHFLVTAAHVLDKCPSGVYLADGLDDILAGPRIVNRLPVGMKREQDLIDIGVVPVARDEASRVGESRFLDLERAVVDDSGEAYMICVALGYPNRDQRVNRVHGTIETAATAFFAGFAQPHDYRAARVNHESHILLRYRRQTILYNSKTRGAPPSLDGMSGCGIWPVTVGATTRDPDVPLLAGIVLGHPYGNGATILAIRSPAVLEFVRRCGK